MPSSGNSNLTQEYLLSFETTGVMRSKTLFIFIRKNKYNITIQILYNTQNIQYWCDLNTTSFAGIVPISMLQ